MAHRRGTDAQQNRCAVRKRRKLHPYLSSACQSPSNRSRNRYRGGSGSTSFSSSTMVLLRAQRQRRISPQTAEMDTPQNKLRAPSSCYSKRRWTNTLIHLMATFSIFLLNRKINFPIFLTPVTMQIYFFPAEATGRRCSSVGEYRGGSTITVTAGEQLVVSPNTSILPVRAPHGCTDCKCVTNPWRILHCCDDFSYQGFHKKKKKKEKKNRLLNNNVLHQHLRTATGNVLVSWMIKLSHIYTWSLKMSIIPLWRSVRIAIVSLQRHSRVFAICAQGLPLGITELLLFWVSVYRSTHACWEWT